MKLGDTLVRCCTALLLLPALWLLTGCMTSRPGSNLSGGSGKARTTGRGIEEYFVGPGVLQYFMLPQRLPGPDRHYYAALDLTVRDSLCRPLWGWLHLSVVGPAALSATDTVLLSMPGNLRALPPARVLFTEPSGKQQLTRLEWRLTPAQLTQYLTSADQAVLVYQAGRRVRYVPTKKCRARLASLRTLTLCAP